MNIRTMLLALSLILATGAADAKSHKQQSPPPNSYSKSSMPDGSGKPQIQQLGEYCNTSDGRYKMSAPQMLGSACSVNTRKGTLQGTVGS